MPTTKTRSTAGANAALEINGQPLAWLKSVEPAAIEFVADPATPGPRPLRIGAFEATLGLGAAGGVLDWLSPLLAKEPVAAEGAVLIADANFQVRRRVDFSHALLTELRLDDLDAASKQALALAFKWQPESVRFSKASGAVALPGAGKRKAWLASNFRVQGLPFDTRFVTRVQWPAVSARLAPASAGLKAGYESVDFSAWHIELNASGADSVLAYADQLVQDGALSDDEYFDCSIELLDSSLSRALATVTLGRCGLLRLAQPAALGGNFALSFSVERFELKLA